MSSTLAGKWHVFTGAALAAATVVWAFVLVGSPSYNRRLAADRNRLEDLANIQRAVESYFDSHPSLPAVLSELEKPRPWYLKNLSDPMTGKPYEYRLKDHYSYELCSDFELSAKEADVESPGPGDYRPWGGVYLDGAVWAHESGHHCFKFDIPEGKLKNKDSDAR